jgi:hypothetical protein
MEDKLGFVVLICVLIFAYVYFFRPDIIGMFTKVDSPREIKTSTTISSTTTTTVSIEKLSACPIDDLKRIIQESAQTRQIKIIGTDAFFHETDTVFSIPIWKDNPDIPAGLTKVFIKGFELDKIGDGYPINLHCKSDDVCVKCRNGENEGENVKYLYCDTYLGLHKVIINSDDVIQKKVFKEVNKFILDPKNNYKVIEINCIDI